MSGVSYEYFVPISVVVMEPGFFIKMNFRKPVVSFYQALHNLRILPVGLTGFVISGISKHAI